ncbi:MAG: ABC transporter ATP-binding protein [Rhodobacteraceae bacterium]|nr:ABC transporter ATP-binding protein [Paracoccaceae bacterium]
MAQQPGTRPVFAPWNDPDQKPLIQFKNVTKRFGDFVAIDDITLDIYRREFFALLGPSGCGKTTLMRMLAGFETPSAGTIMVDGVDIAPIPPNRRPVNMMFQSYALFPHLTVWDNIAFGLRRSDMPKDQIPARVEEMLRLVRLEKFSKRKPHQISGGQRQRVALARSLAKAPKLLLLDEPLGALDKKLRQDTQFELMDIQEKTGTTFVIVTHDQEEAMTVASRVAVMDHGKMIQIDTPDRIYETPNSVYVADFIGDVNILDGKVSASGNGKVELATSDGFTVRTAAGHAPAAGSAAGFAIRPEKLKVTRAAPVDASVNAAEGEIWDIGYLGDMTVFYVKLGSGKVVKASMLNAQREVEDPIAYDEKVWVSFGETAGVVLKD